jgi:hypothetical protein
MIAAAQTGATRAAASHTATSAAILIGEDRTPQLQLFADAAVRSL